MSNITYLLGAGASAEALPTYANFYNRFSIFLNLMSPTHEAIKGLTNEEKNHLIEIHRLVKLILEEFKYHKTPDTIAKKYFHLGKMNDLINLKRILTLFFLYEQSFENKSIHLQKEKPEEVSFFDKRYDSFIATLLKPEINSLTLSGNIKILTWNYDLQFEISFSRYLQKTIPATQEKIQSFPSVFKEPKQNFDNTKFSLIHLNGLAYSGFYKNGKINENLSDSYLTESEFIQQLIYSYKAMLDPLDKNRHSIDHLLSFAWENHNTSKSIDEKSDFQYAKLISENTDILIIIGYSFPFFNYGVDNKLLSLMHRLRKIYIQTNNFNDIKNLLLETHFKKHRYILDESIINIGYTSQFYIPTDFNAHI